MAFYSPSIRAGAKLDERLNPTRTDPEYVRRMPHATPTATCEQKCDLVFNFPPPPKTRFQYELEGEEPEEPYQAIAEDPEPRGFTHIKPMDFGVDVWYSAHSANARRFSRSRPSVIIFGDSHTEALAPPLPFWLYRLLKMDQRGTSGYWKAAIRLWGLIGVWCSAFFLGLLDRGLRIAAMAIATNVYLEWKQPALRALDASCRGERGNGIAYMGITGDCTRHLLWRLNNGELDPCVTPRLRAVIVQAGCNNIGWAGETDAAVVARKVMGLAHAICERFPRGVRVLVCSLHPAADQMPLRTAVNAELKRACAAVARTDCARTVYLDCASSFPGPEDANFRAIFPDGSHLSAEGYDLWAQAMGPALRKVVDSNPYSNPKLQ